MKLTKKTLNNYDKYLIPCYIKAPLEITKGKGAALTDAAGKKFLDFFSGWAVSV